MAAVCFTDRLGDDTIETLANRAFDTWKLGTRGKDNGLLLVLAMDDRKMRFATGYGLEADLPDAVCRRALDEHLRPRLRAGRVKDGVIDALSFLARTRQPGFTLTGRTPPATEQAFDARTGAVCWGLWVALLAWLFFFRGGAPVRGAKIGIFAFLCINPGAFIFVGAALLSKFRAAIWTVIVDHVALPPFYLLVAASVGGPIRLCQRAAVEREQALYDQDAGLRQLRDRLTRLEGGSRNAEVGSIAIPVIASIIAVGAAIVFGVSFGLDYREPPYFLIPSGLFAVSWRLGQRALQRSASVEALRADLEARVRAATARMENLVLRGHARRDADGTYSYTPLYYESQRSSDSSSSSSSSSDFSSSSDGGSSGGGGASSDW
jgi:uncharacterized membrane protein YgcG